MEESDSQIKAMVVLAILAGITGPLISDYLAAIFRGAIFGMFLSNLMRSRTE